MPAAQPDRSTDVAPAAAAAVDADAIECCQSNMSENNPCAVGKPMSK